MIAHAKRGQRMKGGGGNGEGGELKAVEGSSLSVLGSPAAGVQGKPQHRVPPPPRNCQALTYRSFDWLLFLRAATCLTPPWSVCKSESIGDRRIARLRSRRLRHRCARRRDGMFSMVDKFCSLYYIDGVSKILSQTKNLQFFAKHFHPNLTIFWEFLNLFWNLHGKNSFAEVPKNLAILRKNVLNYNKYLFE